MNRIAAVLVLASLIGACSTPAPRNEAGVPAGVPAPVVSISGTLSSVTAPSMAMLHAAWGATADGELEFEFPPTIPFDLQANGSFSVALPSLENGATGSVCDNDFPISGIVTGIAVVNEYPPSHVDHLLAMYTRLVIEGDKATWIHYWYSHKHVDIACSYGADLLYGIVFEQHDLDLRLRPGWNVVTFYMEFDGFGGPGEKLYLRTGEPPFPVMWTNELFWIR